MSGQRMPTWLLIDVSNWAYRDYFGAGPGEPSFRNFVRRVAAFRELTEPAITAMVFDSDESFRARLQPTYKANRREQPPGLAELLRNLESFAGEHSIDVVRHLGFEADDCIATLSQIAMDHGARVVIASSDKDLRQCLVSKRVVLLRNAERGPEGVVPEWYSTVDLGLEYELRPDQWIEYQMLVGDSSDNIAGCPGIGPKTATEILAACSTLELYFERPLRAKITAKQQARLAAWRRDGMDVARTLVTLRRDVPMPAGWFVGT